MATAATESYTPSGTDITIEAGGQIITAGSTAYGIYLGYAQLTIDGADATAGTAAGSIATYGAGAHGISAAYDTTIDNAGDITTSGNSASGIYLSGTGNTLTHSGTITTGGDTGYGIYAAAGTSSSYNAIAIEAGGKIITTGENAYGIYLGDYGVLTIAAADTVNGLVAGSITTGNSTDSSIGDGSYGIYALSNTRITNAGDITTYRSGIDGIYLAGDSNTVTHSGTITTRGSGITSAGGNNVITNSGSILVDGNDDAAISVNVSSSVINSGNYCCGRRCGHSNLYLGIWKLYHAFGIDLDVR